MACEKNKWQAMIMARNCARMRLDTRVCLDACRRHNDPETDDQSEDNEVVLHLMALIKELEIRENGLRGISNG